MKTDCSLFGFFSIFSLLIAAGLILALGFLVAPDSEQADRVFLEVGFLVLFGFFLSAGYLIEVDRLLLVYDLLVRNGYLFQTDIQSFSQFQTFLFQAGAGYLFKKGSRFSNPH